MSSGAKGVSLCLKSKFTPPSLMTMNKSVARRKLKRHAQNIAGGHANLPHLIFKKEVRGRQCYAECEDDHNKKKK